MAEFPTIYPISRSGFQCDLQDGRELQRAMDGTPRARTLYSRNWYDIRFRIILLDIQHRTAVDQFYTSYRNEYIDWVNPVTNQPFKILFGSTPPRVTRYLSSCAIEMEITAIGYIDE